MGYRWQGSACGKKRRLARSPRSTPTQSTPTQFAGNIGAQPKGGMRGRRLYEVAASAHRPCYMDVEYTCTDRIETCVRACVRACTHTNTHTHSSHISPVLNLASLLYLTLGSPASPSEEPKAWGPHSCDATVRSDQDRSLPALYNHSKSWYYNGDRSV